MSHLLNVTCRWLLLYKNVISASRNVITIHGRKNMQNIFDLKELLELLEDRQLRLLKERLAEMNEMDIAAFMEELDSEKTVVVYRMLSKEQASDVFACLPVEKQEHIINGITDSGAERHCERLVCR